MKTHTFVLPGGRKDHRQDAAQLLQFAEGGSQQRFRSLTSPVFVYENTAAAGTPSVAVAAQLKARLVWV